MRHDFDRSLSASAHLIPIFADLSIDPSPSDLSQSPLDFDRPHLDLDWSHHLISHVSKISFMSLKFSSFSFLYISIIFAMALHNSHTHEFSSSINTQIVRRSRFAFKIILLLYYCTIGGAWANSYIGKRGYVPSYFFKLLIYL